MGVQKLKIGLTMYETSFPADSAQIKSVRWGAYPLTDVLLANRVTPLLLPTIDPSRQIINRFIHQIDGLILGGGDDITPIMYHAAPIGPELNYPLRDQFEAAMIRAAIQNRVPILGICRGCQMINVTLGGTLYQNIYKQIHNHNLLNHELGRHPVKIVKNSFLYQALGSCQVVNSRHHQAIRRLGRQLRIVARAPDGIIEGIEGQDADIQGVQWHPENLWRKHPAQERLFQAFFQRIKKI